jgi:hypothetical protein
MACVHTMECSDVGAACKGVGTVWLGGKEDEDKFGVCTCDNQHESMIGGCKNVSRKVGEPCSSSKQCQKAKAVCREKKIGTGRWCTCLANKFEDKTGKVH